MRRMLLFLALAVACALFLWQADDLSAGTRWLAAASAAAGLWLIGALMAGQLRWQPAAAAGLVALMCVAASTRIHL